MKANYEKNDQPIIKLVELTGMTDNESNGESSSDSKPASASDSRKSERKYANCKFQTNSISIKIYPENLSKDGNVIDADDAETWAPVMRATLQAMADDPDCPFWFDSIVHDRCYAVESEDFRLEKLKKIHAHIDAYAKGFYMNGVPSRRSLKRWVKWFAKYGIYLDMTDSQLQEFCHSVRFPDLRKGEDKRLLVYLTHETPAAIKDGKTIYYRHEVITNRPKEITALMYDIYDKCLAYSEAPSASEKAMYCYDARRAGACAYPWTMFLNDLPYVVRFDNRLKAAMLEAYTEGIDLFISSRALQIRCCIFVNGAPNTGKTYTSKMTLQALGRKVYAVEGGKTGKMDSLDSSYTAMCISDTSFGDPLATTDNMPTRMYRRGSGNPLWSGDYLVVSFNGNLDKYIDFFYSDVYGKNPESREAFKSRFYECEIINNRLQLADIPTAVSTRGGVEERSERNRMFFEFVSKFNEILKDYHPVDISDFDPFVGLTESEIAQITRANYSSSKAIALCESKQNGTTAHVPATEPPKEEVQDFDILDENNPFDSPESESEPVPAPVSVFVSDLLSDSESDLDTSWIGGIISDDVPF